MSHRTALLQSLPYAERGHRRYNVCGFCKELSQEGTQERGDETAQYWVLLYICGQYAAGPAARIEMEMETCLLCLT